MNAFTIITRALRRIGILASGDQPTDSEFEDALEVLQGILLRAVSEGAFGTLEDVTANIGTHVAEPNTRIRRDDPDNLSIDLPDNPRDKSVVMIADILSDGIQTFVFDGDISQWIAIEEIGRTSEVPFSQRDPGGMAAYLAVELADEYGQQIPETVGLAAQRYHYKLINDFSRRETSTPRPENYF